ncbi:MAG: hypothetical protein GFH27_549379n26 [Chloroflexi bacterium AL-W]|nr:hypothetical protein [Chloroflexi bacterium AL-N1]NOK71150.1 hypothetical protein [Chloroflexi bacterium AL-N10]NOK78616.1 hypothetical protein [Chloroflexi bacterium AL-N5]NOK85912.1 hypothetical protein [Chloroflexi bacterium AL-W]NOK92887.1 hypothetical protein [Chloroflexi bacterium AL-N15]
MCANICTESFPVWSVLAASWRSFQLHACLGASTGISLVDSTKLAVCHHRRIQQYHVCVGLVQRDNIAVGWLFGCKLSLVCTDGGALVTFIRTPGTINAHTPVLQVAKHLFGNLVGDTGYCSPPLAKQRASTFDDALMTPRRKHLTKLERPRIDKLLLCKRVIVESIIDQLKTSPRSNTPAIAVPFIF